MNNLNANITEIVVTLCLFPFFVMAIWGIMYFSFMIYLRLRIKKELGDMPGREEVSKLYEEINEQIRNPYHSPARENSVLRENLHRKPNSK